MHRDAVSRLGAATFLREDTLGLKLCATFRTHGEVKLYLGSRLGCLDRSTQAP